MNGCVRPGTPRVQGNPTPHGGHGRQRGQAVKAAQHPQGLAFTAWLRCCTLATQEGWGLPRCVSEPCRTQPGTGTALTTSAKPYSAGVEGTPLGGGRAAPARPGRASARPTGWAGANTNDCAKRLARTLCGDGAAVTAHTNGCWACGAWLRLWPSHGPHAQGRSGRKT